MSHKIKIWESTVFDGFDDLLVIHFLPEEGAVKVDIFWKKKAQERFITKLVLPGNACAVRHTFSNGISIRGTLSIQKFEDPGTTDTLGIFADIYYYDREDSSYIWHTDGFLVSLPGKMQEPPVIVIDTEPVVPESSAEPVGIFPASAYSDLFPYIYVSGWPGITPMENARNFFTYAPASPPVPGFVSDLATGKAKADRQGMQQLCVSFVEGDPPYMSGYVPDVNRLKGYLGSFLLYYELLNNTGNLQQIVGKTCTYFSCTPETFSAYLASSEYLQEKERLWSSYFALIILMGYDNKNLEEITQVLTLCNFLGIVFKNLNADGTGTRIPEPALSPIFGATIVLYPEIFPLPPYFVAPASPPITYKPILPYAIGDLQLVKYKLQRYEAGEIASITSIMPGEKRKQVNRRLDRVVDKEITRNISSDSSITTTGEQSNDFNEELWNAIAETTETGSYPGNGMVTSYGPPTNVTISGSYTKTHTTQTPDKKQLSSFAKKILSRTTQRLSEKISRIRAHTELKEREDTSVSLLDNTKNNTPVYGIYSWLNKVYKAQVVNYGNRMLFSFMIPAPAESYIAQTETLTGADLQKPQAPAAFGISTYADITGENYLQACSYYQLKKFPLLAQQTVTVSAVLGISQGKLIALPEGYCADSAQIEYAFGSGDPQAVVNGFVGQQTFTLDQAGGPVNTKGPLPLSQEQRTIAVSAVYDPGISVSPPQAEIDFQMGVQISCKLLPQTLLEWQLEIYRLLSEAYLELLAAYNLRLRNGHDREEDVNPLTRRMTVKLELEKSIRRQLLENAMQVNGLPLSLLSSGTDSAQFNQAEINQYLDSALEWNEMSYTFYETYDDRKGEFIVSSLSPDFFSAYLKASCARVIIPANPAFNYGFLYFLSSGTVWTADDGLAACFPDESTATADQAAIVYELKQTFASKPRKETVVDSWEILVPTSMQILQNRNSLKIKDHDS